MTCFSQARYQENSKLSISKTPDKHAFSLIKLDPFTTTWITWGNADLADSGSEGQKLNLDCSRLYSRIIVVEGLILPKLFVDHWPESFLPSELEKMDTRRSEGPKMEDFRLGSLSLTGKNEAGMDTRLLLDAILNSTALVQVCKFSRLIRKQP